jgi:hypothetical protein
MCRPWHEDMDVGICSSKEKCLRYVVWGATVVSMFRIWWQVGWSEDRARVISED